MQSVSHHLADVMLIDSGRNHHRVLKLVGLMRDRMFT